MTLTLSKVPLVALYITVISLVAFSLAYGQTVKPAVWVYSLKKVNFKWANGNPHAGDYYAEPVIRSWVKTDEKNTIVFFNFRGWKTDDSPIGVTLYSMRISNNGTPSTIKKLWSCTNGDLGATDALWIESGGAGAPKAGKTGTGVVFIAYCSGNNDYKTMKLASATFDSQGELTSTFRNIDEIQVTSDDNAVSYANIAVATTAEKIGVAFATYIRKRDSSEINGTIMTAMHFFETDLSGRTSENFASTPTITNIKIYKNGELQELVPSTPVWTGKRWLVPVWNILSVLKPASWGGYYTGTSGFKFMVLTVEPKGATSAKVRWKKIAYDAPGETWYSPSMGLLDLSKNGATSPPAKPTYILAYVRAVGIPESEQELDTFNLYYNLVPIDDKGKKAGPAKEIALPKWNHKIEYDPHGSLYTDGQVTSLPVINEDGKILISIARGLRWATAGGSTVDENLFELFSIAPDKGALTTLARGDANLTWQVRGGQINFLRGAICVLNQVALFFPDHFEIALYFSKF
jgi:hypothetical protein